MSISIGIGYGTITPDSSQVGQGSADFLHRFLRSLIGIVDNRGYDPNGKGVHEDDSVDFLDICEPRDAIRCFVLTRIISH